MTINQIYSTINSISANMTTGAQNVIDHSSFVNFGDATLSSATNKEQFYSKLVDRIGRTVFAIRSYKSANRNILVDSFTFGSILQKISYKLQDAEESPQWKSTPTNPYTWQAKGGIIQKLYAQDLPTFTYDDVLYDYQLESAFTDASSMAGFISGISTRMYNALEVSIEGMNDEAICAFATEVFKEATDVSSPVNPRRARNLLAEYNTAFPTKAFTSVEDALANEEFLQFACIEMGTVIPFMEKLTSMFNDGTVERFTSKENLVCELNAQFERMYEVYLKSNTFHDTMVALPNYNVVPYWHSPSIPMDVVSNDGSDTTTIENVIAIFRDKDAVATTLEREDYASMYDPINRRTYVRLSADRRYIADTSENCVIFYLDI